VAVYNKIVPQTTRVVYSSERIGITIQITLYLALSFDSKQVVESIDSTTISPLFLSTPLAMYRSPRLILGSFPPRMLLQRSLRSPRVGWQAFSSAALAAPPNGSHLGILAGVAIASGIAGYYVASQSNSSSPYDSLASPKYASKAEIQQAIRELEGLLPSGSVSTNPDVLKLHGFSVSRPSLISLVISAS
jgi:hypothetical protein